MNRDSDLCLTPRQIWLKRRVEEILSYLAKLKEINDWIEFKKQARELACELLYATNEWEKYYRSINEK